ncbi:proton-conducting transporter membrane subunit [Castellaniella caeni]
MRAGFLTLALSEAGALAALTGLLLLGHAAGSWSLADIARAAAHMPPAVAWAGFLLTFFGFGVKTGILPVNIWMGDGYIAAPRGVLPIFSGATLNLGVFTLWVIDGPIAMHQPTIALVMLVTGALTAILGIIYALASHSLIRLLTQSSIENLGIIVAASGAGFAFCALGHPVLGSLSLVAGLYHMLNHSACKTLLFLGAAAIGEAANTDDLDRLGGLMRRVPLFGTLFLFGAFAIAALPPFNSFVSEWLILQSLLRVVELSPVPVRIVFALSGALLALTAGLAVTCFVMLSASALLGLPRSNVAAHVRRMPGSATFPMGVLLAICLALGVLATGVIPLLGRLTGFLTGTDPTASLVPAFLGQVQGLGAGLVDDLAAIGARLGRGLVPLRGLVILHSGGAATPVIYAMSTAFIFVVLALLLFLTWLLARKLRDHHRITRRTVWDAGLVRLQPEMTYTATAFAAPVRVIFDKILRPVVAEHVERQGAFITARHREDDLVHIVDRLTLRPLTRAGTWVATQLARMHHGPVTLYAGYILVVLTAVLLAAAASLD